jgi:anti-sigma B factor antagonist
MQLQVRHDEDIAILDLKGKLVAGTGDVQLRDCMNDLLAENCKKIVLNLSGVTSIDSSGVGELVASKKISERFGAQIRLVSAGEQPTRVLHMAAILPLFQVHDDESSALEALKA